MKTCTCPHEATRNGFMRAGYNSLCPFHGKPLPEVVPPRSGLDELHVKAAPFMRPPPAFCECGHVAGHEGLCERFDET